VSQGQVDKSIELFKRHRGKSNTISRSSFLDTMAESGIDGELAEAIFNSIDTDSSG